MAEASQLGAAVLVSISEASCSSDALYHARMDPPIPYVEQLFKELQVDYCFVGEIALNYYNVPRVLHVRVDSIRDRDSD